MQPGEHGDCTERAVAVFDRCAVEDKDVEGFSSTGVDDDRRVVRDVGLGGISMFAVVLVVCSVDL
jgi:hypothetical protein